MVPPRHSHRPPFGCPGSNQSPVSSIWGEGGPSNLRPSTPRFGERLHPVVRPSQKKSCRVTQGPVSARDSVEPAGCFPCGAMMRVPRIFPAPLSRRLAGRPRGALSRAARVSLNINAFDQVFSGGAGEAGQASRGISTARLHVLPRVHLPPINVIVSHAPSGAPPEGEARECSS